MAFTHVKGGLNPEFQHLVEDQDCQNNKGCFFQMEQLLQEKLFHVWIKWAYSNSCHSLNTFCFDAQRSMRNTPEPVGGD